MIGSIDSNRRAFPKTTSSVALGLTSMASVPKDKAVAAAPNPTLAGSKSGRENQRANQVPRAMGVPVNQNLAKPEKTEKGEGVVCGRQGQNQEETAGFQSVLGLAPNESSPSPAKAGPSVGQQSESQIAVHPEPGLQLPELDLSRMSVGSGITSILTEAAGYPDTVNGAPKRAPDGVYRLGHSVVSVVTTPRPAGAFWTEQQRELDKQRWAVIAEALAVQQVGIQKMREKNEAQIEGVTRQMEALTVRPESKAVVKERAAARMSRVRTTEEAARYADLEKEARATENKIIENFSTEAQGISAPRRRHSLAAQSGTSTTQSPIIQPTWPLPPQLPPTVTAPPFSPLIGIRDSVPSAASNSTNSLIPTGKAKGNKKKKNKKPESKTQSTAQSTAQNIAQSKPPTPPQPKANKHKGSSKFQPQNPANLKLLAPGLIKPPALTIPIEPRPVDVRMLQRLDALVHPLAQLRTYGYTISNPTIIEIRATLTKLGDNAICKRCEKPFVYKDIGKNKISRDSCVHHPGRCSVEVEDKKLATGKPMKVWSCCYKRGFAPGCTTGPTHVLELQDANRLADISPFEATPLSVNTMDSVSKIQEVIALDCEMSYTKYGLALSRMSILSFPDCRLLEDTYIREPYPGVHFFDYNTRFSGVTHKNLYPDDPKNSPPVLEGIIAARSKLWEYCDANTIIIGHGLDHDLKCLRMLHPKIIDTAILFSKINGQKSRLKKLAEVELKWCIQEDTGDQFGHDSVEDCRTCIELVLKYLERPVVSAESAASEIPD